MKKVTILTLHLGYGGIEKSVAALANMLCKNYEVEIISSYKLYEQPAFEIDKEVKIKYLIEQFCPNREAWKEALKNLKPMKLCKESYHAVRTLSLKKKTMIKAIRQSDADIIISTRDIFNEWLGKYGRSKALKIGWEHNHFDIGEEYTKKVAKSARDLDYLVLVSDSIRDYYKPLLKNYNCTCVTIPNVLESYPTEMADLRAKKIISIGRLSREKAYDDLLDVMKLVHEVEPKWELDIIGDGVLRNHLGDRIYNEKLDYIHLLGFQNKDVINQALKQASIYAMSSITESFGIVLLEAMSYGLPCVAFRSAEGACHLISDGENGYLIDNRDKEAMKDQIVSLIKDRKKRIEMGKEGRKTSLKYTSANIKKDWMRILKKRG